MSTIFPLILAVAALAAAIALGRYAWLYRPRAVQLATPLDSDSLEDVEPIKTYPWLYWIALVLLASAYGTLGWYLKGSVLDTKTNLDEGYLVWVIGVLHFASGIHIVRRDKLAGAYVLGIPTVTATGFPLLVPPGLFQWNLASALVIELPWPQDPAKVYRGDGNPPKGEFLPIRIPFAPPAKGEEDDDPYNRRSTNEVSLFVRIRVCHFFDFINRIGDVDAARTQIGNMAINLINRVFTKLTLAKGLEKLTDEEDDVDHLLEEHIKKETRWWGIDVITARVKLIEPSHEFNRSIQQAAMEAANAQGLIARAKGEKEKRTLEGQGAANAVKADILARAEGLKKMADDLNVPVETIIAQEVARAIASGNNEKIILGFDVAKLVEMIAGSFKKAAPTQPAGGTT